MSEARTLRTACPACSGTVPRSEGSRAERCPFCNHRSVLILASGEEELRYSLPTTIDAEEAADRARLELVATRVLSKRLTSFVKMGKPTLYFIPYLWLTATRPGILTRQTLAPGDVGVPKLDSRVIIDDFEAFSPAVDLPGFGLSTLDPGTLLAGAQAPLPESYDGSHLRRQGLVLGPQRSFADLQQWGDWGGTGDRSSLEPGGLIAERRRILFVPIWSVPYEVFGQRFDARLDATAGQLLSGRAPEDGRFRAPLALAAAALPALLLGKFFALLLDLGVETGAAGLQTTASFVVPIGALLLALVVVMLAFSWSLVRYEAENVFDRGSLWAEQLGKPRLTALDRLAAAISKALAGSAAGSRR